MNMNFHMHQHLPEDTGSADLGSSDSESDVAKTQDWTWLQHQHHSINDIQLMSFFLLLASQEPPPPCNCTQSSKAICRKHFTFRHLNKLLIGYYEKRKEKRYKRPGKGFKTGPLNECLLEVGQRRTFSCKVETKHGTQKYWNKTRSLNWPDLKRVLIGSVMLYIQYLGMVWKIKSSVLVKAVQ